MNVSSQPLVLPTAHRRRFLTMTRSPMFIDASPVAVSNKIKAIQARKTRLYPLTNNSSYTDVRPLNFSSMNSAVNSKGSLTVLTAERLVDRSNNIRLDRIVNRQPARASVLSTTSVNQQSLLWPNYRPSTGGNKQPQTHSTATTITPPAIESIKNKSPGGQMPQIPRRCIRQPLIDRQNSSVPIELPQKSTERSTHPNLLTYERDENLEEVEMVMDKEFEEYFEKAIIKCADWLLKYVFTEKNN